MGDDRIRRYWQANPECFKHTHLLKKHEALHVIVAQMFGAEPKYIILRRRTGQANYSPNPLPMGWQEAAVRLAPVLIDDMSPGDADSLLGIPRRRLGYAWGWLRKNRRRILAAATRLEALMGEPPGRLEKTAVGWAWKPKREKTAR